MQENTTAKLDQWTGQFYTFLQQHPSLSIDKPVFNWRKDGKTSSELAKDEAFWNKLRNDFLVTEHPINLNSGAVSSGPVIVEEAYIHFYRLINTAPSYFLWKIMEAGKEVIREGLSHLINASKDEVAILRNATEASNNVIFGLNLFAGDEVVLCKQDYAKVLSSFKQRELRECIKLSWVDIDPDDSNETIVRKYADAITPKTKLLHLTHVINWNGQVLPIAAIIKEAKQRGVEVMLDGAHSFAKLETDMAALGCDYFITALHKWLSGPIPSGMLYVRKEKIASLWPLSSGNNPQSGDIRKFEELSIQLYPNVLGLGFAIDYYNRLGRDVKEERLRYLRRLWTEEVDGINGLHWNTPLEEERCCTIVNCRIEGMEPQQVEKKLLEEHNIHVGIVTVAPLQGIRVTPNIYTRPGDVQALAKALKVICTA
jgi:selenocysteine lyase/cysteine desulfurase